MSGAEAQHPYRRESDRTGLGHASLRQAIHDLRAPLNTVSILLEVVRMASEPASDAGTLESLQNATRSVQDLGAALARLQAVGETLAIRLQPVRLREALTAALGRAAPEDGVVLGTPELASPDVEIASCPDRLGAMLDTLIACAVAALPRGGRLRLSGDDQGDCYRIAIQLAGEEVALPSANSARKLVGRDPGPADWFLLHCQVEGIGAELAVAGAASPPGIEIRFPRP